MALFSEVFYDATKEGCKIHQGYYLSKGLYPIMDQGRRHISGYTNESSGLFCDVPAIIFGDHTRCLKYADTPFFLGADGVKLLKARDPDANYKYLYYALSCAKIPNTGYNRHFKWLKEVDIPLPDRETQSHIVAVLDRLNTLARLRKHQLEKLDELVKVRFIELFGDMELNQKGWAQAPLDNLADIVSGITKGRKIQESSLLEVPYMAVSNVKDGYIDCTNIKTIMAAKAEVDRCRILSNDVLMTEGGDPDKLGRGAVIQEPPENCIHQNHIFRVRLNQSIILPVFFAEYLQHQKAKRYFLGCAKQTTGIASINMKQLRALPVLAPPIDQQNLFSDFVKKIDWQKSAIRQSLDKLEVLKKSLMQEYFAP